MTNRQVQVDLMFSANTQNAKQQLNDLQLTLSKISSGTDLKVDSQSLQQAQAAAKELSIHLNNAFNAKTGKFDLSLLDKSLKQSGQNVQHLSTQLLNAGQLGQQAFMQLSNAISSADRPIITMSKRMEGLMTTLKNTAKWQISSTVLQGFTSAISNAVNYTKQLNKNLTDIRIVTGYSADKMADFAKEANKAAKSLGTTTNEYAKASLIYFQQGLNDQQVKERTDITVKMANVTRQSAEEVSDQLTAIWNNFDNGSKSLEYYADVLTALGAATASSSTEISEGLEKFAAVAETVGLSYEYAASALATVTAQTRQSADVVGTAFKTLFARIQDLELGKTLDDGTTLGQYSEALAKVGVNIKNSAGQMKDMNTILDEMGAKWNTLSKDTQTAVAQSVAGTRQYTQLIALMDNYDYFKRNLDIAQDSEGTLTKQANIYAESWDAARKKVTASLEGIYEKLLDDKFFIKAMNGFSSFLDSIGAVIDGLGGLKGILISVSSILMQMYAGKIAQGMSNLAHSFQIMWGGAAKAHAQITAQMTQANEQAMAKSDMDDFSKQQLINDNRRMAMKDKMAMVEENLTDLEKQRYNQDIQILDIQQQELIKLQEKKKAQEEYVASLKEEQSTLLEDNYVETDLGGDFEDRRAEAGQRKKQAAKLYGVDSDEYKAAKKEFSAIAEHGITLSDTRTDYTKSLAESYITNPDKDFEYDFIQSGRSSGVKSITQNFDDNGEMQGSFALKDRVSSQAMAEAKQALQELKNDMEAITSKSAPNLDAAIEQALQATSGPELKKGLAEIQTQLKKTTISADKLGTTLEKNLGQDKVVKKFKKNNKEMQQANDKLATTTENIKNKTEALNKAVANFNPKHVMTGIEAFMKLSGGIAGATMGMTQLMNLFDTWNNQDLSIGEKITSTIMALTMSVPMIMQAVGSMQQFGQAVTAARAAQVLLTQAINDKNVTSVLSLALSEKEAGAVSEETMKKLQQTLVEKGLATETNKQAMANEFLAKTKLKATMAGKAKAAGDALEVAGSKAVEGATVSQTGAIVANTAAWYTNPITAIIAVAMLAVAGAVLAVTAGMKANSEAIQENSKKATEKVEKTREEVKVNGDLVDSYLTLYNTYKTTGEGKEELYNISQDLVDIYGIEGGAIAALAGDYKGLTKSIIEARKAELSKQKSSENTAQIAQAAALINKGTEGNGNTLTEGRFKGEFDNDVWGSQFGTDDDEFGIDTIIKSGNYKYLKINGGDIAFNINKNKVNEVYGLYNELHRFASEMEAAGVSSDSDIYNDVIEEIESTEEQFLVLQESVQAEREAIKEESMLSATFDNGKTIGDIQNIHDYNKFSNEYRENYEQILKEQGVVEGSSEWKDEMNSIDNFLLSHSITGKYAQIEKGLKDLNVTDEIKEQLKDLSEEDLQTLWTIKIDPDMTIEEIHKAIEIAQEEAEKFNIYFTPKIQEKGLKLLNEANFEELKKLFDENYKILGMNYMTFLQKFGGDLDGARAFLSGSGKKIENEARLYKSSQESKLYKTKSDDAKEAKKYFDKYNNHKITKNELLSALKGNQYLGDITDYLEQEELVKSTQETIDKLKVGNKDYKDIRTTDKNYFDFSAWWDWTSDYGQKMLTKSKSYQEVGNKTTFKFYDGSNYGNWGVDIGMETDSNTMSQAESKLQEAQKAKGSDVGRRLNELDEIYENGSKFTTSFANGMNKQKVAALNVILESNPEALSAGMKTALQEYKAILNAGGDTTNAVKTLNELTNGKFSQEVLNREYTIDNKFVDVSAGSDKMYVMLSNEGLEDLMEGEDGFINRVLNIIDYEAQYSDYKTTKEDAETERTRLSELIRTTNIQTAEKNLQKAYEFNMEYMIQRETLIEQQGLNIETWKALTAQIMANNKALDIASAEKVAENLMLQNRAVQELQNSWQEYTDILNSATSSIVEQVEAIGKLREIISKMTGGAGEKISQTWLQNKGNQEIIYRAMTDSSESAQRNARFSIAQGILQGYGADEKTVERIVSSLEDMKDGTVLEEGDQWISNILRGEIGKYKLDSMTAEDEAGLLNLFGYSVQPLIKHYPKNHVKSFIDNKDGTYTITDSNDITRTFNAQDVVVQYGTTKDANGNEVTDTSVVKGYDVTYINSALTKKDSTSELNLFDLDEAVAKKQDAADMSKQTILLNYQLEQTDKLLNNLSEDADRAFGNDKVKLLRQYGQELKKALFPEDGTKGFYDHAIEQAEQNAQNLGKIVGYYAKEAGVDGANTLFSNEDFAYNSEAVVDYFQQQIKILIEAGDILAANGLQGVLNNYIESANQVQDSLEEKAEGFREWQENNLAIITEGLEYNIGNLDDEITLIERKLARIQDDAYKAAEAFKLMFGENTLKNGWNIDSMADAIEDKLVEYENTIAEYETAYANNEISPEQFATKMKEMRDAIYESVDALYEEDEQMKEFYGNTLANAQEEIGKYTSLIEHQNTVLDHFANLSKLIGKEIDYEWMGEILSGQTVVLGQLAKESQIAYNNLLDDVASFEEQYNQAVALKKDEKIQKRLKNQWLEAQQAAAEKQDEMLQDLAAWAEAEQALLENSLNQFRKTFEKALTGGLGFDLLSSNMDKTQSLQEEYLTTTNKIYETNKLISNAQKEIDKTTNSVAKKKLADFQKQTEALGKQTKLSQFELNIQQAKYDLLLAEIALEEAQNAKSQVRLRRDNEGNFSYVYTADQQKIADAEQEFMDAENKLYNVRLDGANDYISKQTELNQQYYDDMIQLEADYQSGVITSREEFLERQRALTEWYTEMSKQYSYLETIAIVDDQRIQKEAWTKSYKDIVFSTDQFSSDIDTYMGRVDGAFVRWQGVVDQVEITTGADLESLRDKVGEITTKSTELSKALLGDKLDGTGGVAGALETVMDNCVNAVNYYTTTLFPYLDSLAKKYDGIAESASAAAEAVGKEAQFYNSDSEWHDVIRNALQYFDEEQMDDLRTLYENTLNYTNKKSWADFLELDKETQRKFLQYGTNLEPKEDSGEENKVQESKYFTVRTNAPTYPHYRVLENGPIPVSTGTLNRADEYYYDKDQSIYNKASKTRFFYIGEGLYVSEKDITIVNSASYDTGGYTGTWGPEGRWAMLHQKEIVLNAHDTENLLGAVNLLRDIVSTIDIQSAFRQLVNISSTTGFAQANREPIEQNVHIEASFPSVTDHNELEIALNNLINEASQYVNRK